jgi:hypothetical protein
VSSARAQIEMVNSVFAAMMGSAKNGKSEAVSPTEIDNWRQSSTNPQSNNDEDDLTSPAVHIFLYFIQVKKRLITIIINSIMETLIN